MVLRVAHCAVPADSALWLQRPRRMARQYPHTPTTGTRPRPASSLPPSPSVLPDLLCAVCCIRKRCLICLWMALNLALALNPKS